MSGGRALVLLVALQFVLVGCVGQGGSQSAAKARLLDRAKEAIPLNFNPQWFEIALPNGGDHNHKDLAQHQQLSTPNFQVVGWNPLITDYHGKSAGGYFCGDVSKEKNGRRLAVVHSWVSDVAFILLDVSDPANPQKLSEFALANTHVYDLAITPDQNYLLLGTIYDGQGSDAGASPLPPLLTSRDECTGIEHVSQGPEQGLPFASGLILVDIKNARNPQIADFRHFPVMGSHSVFAADLGGHIVGVSTVENIPGEASYYVFYDILETMAGGRLNLLSIYSRAQASPDEVGKVNKNIHDAWLQKHPVTGANVAYLADGNNGLIVLNIDDPRMPRVIGTWNDWAQVGGYHSSHYIHSMLPIEGTWDGKHYLFMSEECPGGRPPKTPSCLVYAMDTTDPSKPRMAGAWTFPFDAGGWQYPGFSMHYMALVNRTLFVSAFHAGVWAIDVSTAQKIHDMTTIGVFLPDREPPKGFLKDHNYHRSPETADVIAMGDGNLLTFEETSGAYVIHFDVDHPAPAPTPWPIPGSFYGNP